MTVLDRVKPEIVALRETIVVVSEPQNSSSVPAVKKLITLKNETVPGVLKLWVQIPAGVLLDSAPHSKNRGWKRLWRCHPGTFPLLLILSLAFLFLTLQVRLFLIFIF